MRLLTISLLLVLAGLAAPSTQAPRLFDFHSAFWVNLHHYLHALARSNGPRVDPWPASMTADGRAAWTAAVDTYRQQFGTRSLLFDETLVRLKLQLAAAPDDSLGSIDIATDHRRVLESVAPVYRRHWWKAHDEANRRFIAAVTRLLAQHGAAIASRLAATYDSEWPSEPVRVDVVLDAGPPGNAYTFSQPTQIVIAADDARHSGLAALELMFHEASHRWDALLMKEVEEAARTLGVRAPNGLWHALLFYNAGAITTETLERAGHSGYQMYMVAQRVFAFPGWHEAIARHWPAFLAGQRTRPDVIAAIVREIAAK